jgi:hypothetical protein
LDLRTYIRVIWRFRLICAIGLALAIVLGVMAYANVSFAHGRPTLKYRQSQTFEGTTTIAVTQAGYPVGAVSPATGGPASGLAYYYAGLVTSDAITRLARQYSNTVGTVAAQVELGANQYAPLPFIDVHAFASTPTGAVSLANGVARALETFSTQQQALINLRGTHRIRLPQINIAQKAKLYAARRKTTPVVIFLTVLIATIGLAFILENLRPRVHVVGRDVEDTDVAESRKRSA